MSVLDVFTGLLSKIEYYFDESNRSTCLEIYRPQLNVQSVIVSISYPIYCDKNTLNHFLSDWGAFHPWIGLRPVDGIWRWHGRITSILISDTLWNDDEPDHNDGSTCGCVTDRHGDDGKGICDCICTQKQYYICEKQ